MRLAIFSDVHGNPYACEAVLKAIAAEEPFDEIVAAGDLCLGGSDPARCVDMLRGVGVRGVYGNTEEYLYAPEETPPDEMHRRKWDTIQPVAYWVLERLGPERLAWLKEMPFELRFSPSGDPGDDLLVVHGNPRNNELQILPSPEEQIKIMGEVRQPDDDAELIAHMEGVTAKTLAFGHLHYTFVRNWRGYRLVDVAPCSVAQYDGDERARFTIFTWDGKGWEIERRYAAYDYRQEATALRSSDMPDRETWASFFEKLNGGGF